MICIFAIFCLHLAILRELVHCFVCSLLVCIIHTESIINSFCLPWTLPGVGSSSSLHVVDVVESDAPRAHWDAGFCVWEK